MIRTAILVNPTSGKGRSAKNAPAAVQRLREHGMDVEVLQADSAQGSVDLASQAIAGGAEALIACGGDGTVHCALQAVAGTDATLGIIPVGTGDDIARALGIPRDDPRKAVDVIAAGRTREIDYGLVRTSDGTEQAFLAVVSAGFDSQVNHRANRMKWPSGQSRYLVATFAELGVYKPVDFTITVDGNTTTTAGMMLAIGNGTSYGGGMMICPRALFDDGQLDLTFLTKTSKATFIKTFPSVFKGTHVDHPSVQTMRGEKVHVVAEGQSAFADGEYVGPLPMDVEVVPNGLKVFAPTD